MDADSVIQGKSRPSIARPSQPARSPRYLDVHHTPPRHPETIGLQGRNTGQPASNANCADRLFGRCGNRVPPVPHAEDRASCKPSSEIPIAVSQWEQVAASLESSPRPNDLLDPYHHPTVSRGSFAAVA